MEISAVLGHTVDKQKLVSGQWGMMSFISQNNMKLVQNANLYKLH